MNLISEIRSSWGWIGIEPEEIVGENDFGNLMIRDVEGKYWRLCPEDVYCKVVAGNRKELVPQLICRTGRDDAAVPGRLRPGIYEKARYRPDEPDLWRSLLPAYGRSDFLFRS